MKSPVLSNHQHMRHFTTNLSAVVSSAFLVQVKSKCLKLVRRFFEECLAWEDGVQFQYLASQNTMAALVGGATVHSCSINPVNATDAAEKVQTKGKDGDVDELFTK